MGVEQTQLFDQERFKSDLANQLERYADLKERLSSSQKESDEYDWALDSVERIFHEMMNLCRTALRESNRDRTVIQEVLRIMDHPSVKDNDNLRVLIVEKLFAPSIDYEPQITDQTRKKLGMNLSN